MSRCAAGIGGLCTLHVTAIAVCPRAQGYLLDVEQEEQKHATKQLTPWGIMHEAGVTPQCDAPVNAAAMSVTLTTSMRSVRSTNYVEYVCHRTLE